MSREESLKLTCDNCGLEVVDASGNTRDWQDDSFYGWVQLWRWVEGAHETHFCSLFCLAKWAEAEHAKSRETPDGWHVYVGPPPIGPNEPLVQGDGVA